MIKHLDPGVEMGHLLQVFQDGVNSITAERWRDACGKAEKTEKFYW